jgi:microcystin-dependent protein
MKYKKLLISIVIFYVLYYIVCEKREYFTVTGETATKQIVTSDMNGNLISTNAQHLLQLPIGSIIPWVFPTIPEGWLLCDGNTFSGDQYKILFEILGTYTLPDLRGKVPVGKSLNDDGLLSEPSKESARVLTTLPTHNHGISYYYSHSSIHSGNNIKGHPVDTYGSTRTKLHNLDYTGGDHTGIDTAGGDYDWITPPKNTGNAGTASPNSFSIVQKTYVVNYIIKY